MNKMRKSTNAHLKPILPTLRERKRYLKFKILPEDKKFDFSTVSSECMTAMFHFIGTKGMAEAGFFMLADKYKNNEGLIRVNHTHVQYTKAALALIATIQNQQVIVHTLGVSGTIYKIEKKYAH